jgi:hypothetical protein
MVNRKLKKVVVEANNSIVNLFEKRNIENILVSQFSVVE